MKLKSDENFKEKLACSFKHDKEFGEFLPSHFDGLFLSKVLRFEIKNTVNRDAKFE